MPARTGPTIQQRRLGSELRRLREGAGVSQRDASEHIDGGQGKLSKIETGRQNIRRLELLALLDLYQVEDQELRNGLASLLRDSRRRGWWHQYGNALSADMLDMVSLEEKCDRIVHYSNMALPGLLQTAEYATAMISGLESRFSDEEVEFYVQLRMRRQQIFERADPPQFIGVLDEAALRRPVGGPEVMARQLRRLIEVSRRPEVVIQVVPFDKAVHPGVHGSFRVLFDSSPTAVNVVEMPRWTGGLYVEEPEQVECYRWLFDEIRSSAVSSRQSVDLVSRILREFEHYG